MKSSATGIGGRDIKGDSTFDTFHSPVKFSANSKGHGAVDGKTEYADSDDAIVDIPLPSPEKNSTNPRGLGPGSGGKSFSGTTDKYFGYSEKMSPDRSTGSFEVEGLRTQPTQTPKQKASHKKSAASNVSIMGTVFETKKKKHDHPTKKKTGGLYLPSYSRK